MEHATVRSNSQSHFDAHTRVVIAVAILALHLLLFAQSARGASHWETQKLFYGGRYDECIEIARNEVQRGVWNEAWPKLLIKCLMARGQYAEAEQAYEQALKRYANRLELRLLGHEVYRMVDQQTLAKAQLNEIARLAQLAPWRYSSSADQVTLGRFFQLGGEDARQILELVYDSVRKRNARFVDVYVATAELALEKHDYQLAAKNLETALKLRSEDPQIHYLQARAWMESDPQKANLALQSALELNPRHVPSLLLQVDHLIDAERYTEAESVLEQILEVNLFEPNAWAYYAVIAHLKGKYQGENALRQVALSTWPSNYQVDHLIGRKLSQKYRFADGATYQRRALVFRKDYWPAQFQLAQDLLRLGEDTEGWQLAEQVQKNDEYHVVAFNLMSLKDQLDRYRELSADGLIVRMESREADLYGQQVLALLQEARSTLCAKYEIELDNEPIIVEIFPRQQDFAIRTFGLPGGAGYLGVCFGRVITANSPASQGNSPSNWQSVLWHEYCHVVTLTKTKNRMPRWLSEGISVYEERQRNAAWGQRMTPQFRQMILGGELSPVSQLSGAFLRPKSPLHLQFAYYESSLVVDFLIQKHGLETLLRVLDDLGVGMPIAETLQRYVGPPAILDQQFEKFAKQQAESLSPQLDWDAEVVPDPATPLSIAQQLQDHPNNYWLLRQHGGNLFRARQWAEARDVLELLYEDYPEDTTPGNAGGMLARVYRELGDEETEEKILRALASVDDDAIDVYLRLLELDEQHEDWERLREDANLLLAVNPLLPQGHAMLAKASNKLGRFEEMVDAQAALLQLDPADPAKTHFDLATGLHQLGRVTEARRQVLMALEAAPRYRDAQRLLLELVDHDSDEEPSPEHE